jgi:hypothetical protein
MVNILGAKKARDKNIADTLIAQMEKLIETPRLYTAITKNTTENTTPKDFSDP